MSLYGKNSSMGYDPASVQKYTFPTEKIPRVSVNDNAELLRLMQSSSPVVITDSGLVRSALKWNLSYLQRHLTEGYFYVYSSKDNRFKYYDNKRAGKCKAFPIPIKRDEVTFNQFIDMLKTRKNTKEKVYLQQTLSETIGKTIVKDCLNFNVNWAETCRANLGWGTLTSNLLLIGLQGNITPAHYDEQENLFSQISGYKRCILFAPDQFENLYPHPVAHPCDRQSQVDFSKPDFERFPKFRNAKAMEAIVGPGDVLYIPMYWWHQIESLSSDPPSDALPGSTDSIPVTISVNFWYRAAPLPDQMEYPLTGQQRVAVMRNVEKLLAGALGSADEVGKLLRTMVNGRYTDE